MKKNCLSVIFLSFMFLLPNITYAEKELIIEDVAILSQFENNFIINYQDPNKSGLDCTVTCIKGKYDSEGSFQNFRVDFNVDTTDYVRYKDLQSKRLFVLKNKGLKCKVQIVNYLSYVKKIDPLFGPNYWFKEVKLKITVWSTN